MSEETQPDMAELRAGINAARRAYDGLRDQLVGELGRHFSGADDVADRLLSVVDEFGSDRALELLSERPDDYGDRIADRAEWPSDAPGIASTVEKLYDAHERLDVLTAQLEQLQPREDGKPVRIFNIQGRAYEFDPAVRELREIETGERHRVDLGRSEAERSLSPTQLAARELGASKARPRTVRDRDRERDR